MCPRSTNVLENGDHLVVEKPRSKPLDLAGHGIDLSNDTDGQLLENSGNSEQNTIRVDGNGTTNTTDNSDLVAGLLLRPENGCTKRIPVRFLYDDLGSQIYEQITELEEYYPYSEEKNLLHAHADDIISHLPPKSIVVELGCGDGSKTALLLNALVRRDGADAVKFVGIDVSGGALQQARLNLQTLCPDIPPENLEFIEAEYYEGLREAHRRHPTAPLCMLWLGSSVGNFTMDEAAVALREFKEAAGEDSVLLLCTDLWKDEKILKNAYDDPKGVTRAFILNGMVHALRTLGIRSTQQEEQQQFEYHCVVNSALHQVEMWVESKNKIENVLPGVHFEAGEQILMEISRKFTAQDISALAQHAGLCVHSTWASEKYSMQLLLPPTEAFRRCWADTDALFSHISDWGAQPIGLRHPFAFYFGHVAAFALLKLLPERTPSSLDVLLSRGIDPLVLDPSHCHSHPTIPEKWPSVEEYKEYVAAARNEILKAARATATAAAAGDVGKEKKRMHALVMTLEHERMHQETLCYMCAQQRKHEWFLSNGGGGSSGSSSSSRGGSPNGNDDDDSGGDLPPVSSFYFNRCSYLNTAAAASSSSSSCGEDEFLFVPGGTVTLGIDLTSQQNLGFVWDNELGTSQPCTVQNFNVSTSPVSVAQFRKFVVDAQGYSDPTLWENTVDFEYFKEMKHSMPATWSVDACSGEIYVHMPDGTFHWKKVENCPVYCSLAEAQAYCKLSGGGSRIMSEAEYQHLLSARSSDDDEEEKRKILNLKKCLMNDGFEWTSTEFAPFTGFEADPLYLEYSTDFFDGRHFVLKGSSPYTHPSVCRKSFRNYYQLQYPYMFAKFRVVKTE